MMALDRIASEPLDVGWLSALVAQHTSDMAVVTGTDGRIIWCNAPFEEISGYGLSEVIGRTPGSFLQGPRTDQETVLACRRALKDLTSFSTEILNYNRAGKPYWVHMRIDPVFGSDGRHTHFIAIERDITARKAAEERERISHERLKVALDSGSDALWCVELGGRGSYFAAAACSQLKRFECEDREFDPMDVLQHAHPDDRHELRQGFRLHLTGEDLDVTARLRSEEGEWRWYHCKGRLIRSTDGTAVRSLGLVSDVTGVRSTQERAEEAARAKSEMLAYTAHEIRNLLNGLSGTTQLLLWSGLDGRPAELVERLQKNCRMLNKLVTQSLDLSRIEAGLFQLKDEPFQLGPMIEDVSEALVDRANAKGLELLTKFDLSAETCVSGDRDSIQQVLLNLVSNAIKFTKRGNVTIGVKRALSGDIAFEVSDTGPGIREDEQSTVFDRFHQASGTDCSSGSGLGLHISSQLVRLMGGRIGLDSSVGEGSRFYFAIPLGEVSDATAVRLRCPCSKAVETPSNLGTARVLLVEDDPTGQELASELLGFLGISGVTVAGSGEEAIGLAIRRKFDLMIFDHHLDGMSGTEAISHLRTVPGPNQGTPIVFLSGCDLASEVTAHRRVTAVKKPMDTNRFLGIVQGILT